MHISPPPSDPASRYQREHIVGEGAMGRVWLAIDRQLGRPVAFKEAKGEADSPAAARLRREAVILARLSHPAIVPLIDAGSFADGRPFLTMRLLDGQDLDHAPVAKTLSDRLARVRQLRDVIAGIAHAHGKRIVHRDLKPANVRLEDDGAVQILDWGLARILRGEENSAAHPMPLPLTRAGSRIGTPAYMSPEQAAGEEATPSSDVWSLGILLWEALGARRAYQGTSASEVLAGVLSNPPPPIQSVAPDVPTTLAEAVDAALSPMSQRPADARALLTSIDAALATIHPNPRSRLPLFVSMSLLVVLLGVGIWAWPKAPPPPLLAPDQAITLSIRAGSVADAERVAALQLLADPDDPIARGALARSVPRPRLLWSAPTPHCSIGEAVRWDGTAIACASAQKTEFFTVDATGLHLAWTRPEEYHRLSFQGDQYLIGIPPQAEHAVRMNISDGSGTTPFSKQFSVGTPQESRTDTVALSTQGDLVHRAVVEDSETQFTHQTITGRPASAQTVVARDGSDFYIDGQSIIRTHPDGTGQQQAWQVPIDEGRPIALNLSSNGQFMVVSTSRGNHAVSPTETESWSLWSNHDLQGARHLAVADDGRHAVGTSSNETVVWSSASPRDFIRLPGTIRAALFVDPTMIVAYGAKTTTLWKLDRALAGQSRQVPGRVRHLVWTPAGMAARHEGGARVWDDNGALIADIPGAIGMTAEEGGERRAVVTPDHMVQVYNDTGLEASIATSGCPFLAWPSGRSIVCASPEGGPILVDPATGRIDATLSLPRHRWYAVEATGSQVLLMDWDTKIFSLGDGTLNYHLTVPWTTRAKPDEAGESVYLNGRDGCWRRSLRDEHSEQVSQSDQRSHTYQLSPDHSMLAVSNAASGFQIWDTATGELRLDVQRKTGQVSAIAWAPDGRRLAVGDHTGAIRVFDLSVMDATPELLVAGVQTAWSDTDP